MYLLIRSFNSSSCLEMCIKYIHVFFFQNVYNMKGTVLIFMCNKCFCTSLYF